MKLKQEDLWELERITGHTWQESLAAYPSTMGDEVVCFVCWIHPDPSSEFRIQYKLARHKGFSDWSCHLWLHVARFITPSLYSNAGSNPQAMVSEAVDALRTFQQHVTHCLPPKR